MATARTFKCPLLRPNDKAFLTAYEIYFANSTVEARAAWQSITDRFADEDPTLSADAADDDADAAPRLLPNSKGFSFSKKLPPRAVKKMLKVYAEVCARSPPRNCKLTQKGFEERLRWALYLESRETALMLFGSGTEAKDMMRHLYYNHNQLPIVRGPAAVAADEARLLPLLLSNPVTNVHAEAHRTAAARIEAASAHEAALRRDNCDDSRRFAAAALDAKMAANNAESGEGLGKAHAASVALEASLGRAAFYSPPKPAGTSLEEVAAATTSGVLRVAAGGISADAAAAASDASTAAKAQISADGRLLEPFAVERAWSHAFQSSLVPDHLYRETVFNHYPHAALANKGALTVDTVAASASSLLGASSASASALVVGESVTILPKSRGVGGDEGKKSGGSGDLLVFSTANGGSANFSSSVLAATAASAQTGEGATALLAPPAPEAFIYAGGPPPAGASAEAVAAAEAAGFTEDPFLPLWAYINELFSNTDLTRERPWVLEDTEMFLLILRSLLYRLDWENATKFVLLLTQTSPLDPNSRRSPSGAGGTQMKIAGYSDLVGGGGEDTKATMHPEWTFAIDQAVADMFDTIGDPQGFLPFKTATKLFDGRLVNKSNRMGRVAVKPLLDAAGVKEDTSEHGDGAKKRRFV